MSWCQRGPRPLVWVGGEGKVPHASQTLCAPAGLVSWSGELRPALVSCPQPQNMEGVAGAMCWLGCGRGSPRRCVCGETTAGNPKFSVFCSRSCPGEGVGTEGIHPDFHRRKH